jgi:hypothetical protein
MSLPVITENSMYKDAAGRAAIVADPKLATELFFVNFLGFVGLYALNDSRGYMKTHEATEKKLRISEIADDNHDSSLAVKLCVDAGVLPEAKAYSITRFLNLIKTRVVRAKDVDDAKVRALVAGTALDVKPMSGVVKAVVSDFMSGKIGIKEFSRLIYDVSKKTEWRDYSTEFRTIVLKGQYTDYFTVMKRNASVTPTTTAAAPAPALPPAYVPPVVSTPAAPKLLAPPSLSAMSSQERLIWIFGNWNADAVVKLDKSMNGLETFGSLSWQDAIEVCKRHVLPKWQDVSFWSRLTSMASNQDGKSAYAMAAAICALVELRNEGGIGISGLASRVATIFNTDWQEKALFHDGFEDICNNIKLDSPFAVHSFSSALHAMFPIRNLRWTKGIDLKSSDINKSHVFLLPFIDSKNMAAIGTIIEVNNELLIPVDSSPEVVAWVKKHGSVFSPWLVNDVARPKGATPASAYMKGIMSSMPEDRKGGPVSVFEIARMKEMTSAEWDVVAREVGDELVKTDPRFMQEDGMASRKIFSSPNDGETFAKAISAAMGYLVNFHPKLAKDRGQWTSITIRQLMRAPVTQEKYDLLVSVCGYSYRSGQNIDSVNALALLESVLKDVPDLSEGEYVLPVLLASAAQFDLGAAINALKGIVATNNRTLRTSMLYLFSGPAENISKELVGPELYPCIRWAWGISGDDMVAMINAGSTYTGGMTDISGPGILLSLYWPKVRELTGPSVYDKVSSAVHQLPVYAWGAKVLEAIDMNRFSATGRDAYQITKVLEELDANDPDDAAMMAVYATRIIPHMANGIGTTEMTPTIALTKAMVLAGGDRTVMTAKMNACVKYMISTPKNTVLDIAQAVRSISMSNLVDLIDRDAMISLVNKLSKSTSKAALESLPLLAFGNSQATSLSPLFVEAVRAARCERAVINRVVTGNAVRQALSVVNNDPNGVKLKIDGDRINTFLKFNDIDVTAMSAAAVSKLEDLGKARQAIATVVPPLAMTDISTPEVNKDRTKYLHRNNQYNHGKQLGMEVKRTFTVDIKGQRERFDAWVAAHPNTRILTLFHGTGTINAAFILRFGFKIIKSSDPSVTGRMLGDGIYFADNINKSMLYMSNAGYVREAGQEGYVMKCKVALGNRPKDNREGAKEHTTLVSNEWAIFNLDQIVIEEAYYGHSRWKQDVKGILEENAYRPMESCFMFMDGRVPVTMTDTADFETIVSMGDHITIERTAKGPIVNIRHDASVKPMDRCYRYGEEMQSSDNAKELKVFLKLLSNTY